MQTLRRFWNALEQIPGGETDRLEWQQRLGDEWQLASRYLQPTNDRAHAVGCPSPGGDECPRTVIDLGDGRYRAVCQARPPLCEPLDLSARDIAIFALNRPRLFKDLAAALDSSPRTPKRATRDPIVEIGRHAVAAGVWAPVFLALPDPRDVLTEGDLRAAGLGHDPAVLLLLSWAAMPPALRGRLQDGGHELLLLPEIIGTAAGDLAPAQPPAMLLQRVRTSLQARLTTSKTSPSWPLPPDTCWEQITMRLKSTQEILCSVGRETRPLSPDVLGLRNARNGRPTATWAIVTAVAEESGRFRFRDPGKRESGKKHVEQFRAALRTYFGLTDDPIPWDRATGEYATRFVIKNELPKQEQERSAAKSRRPTGR